MGRWGEVKGVCVCVWCGVVRCVCVVWHAENPVCRFITPPCVHSKRLREYRQHVLGTTDGSESRKVGSSRQNRSTQGEASP